MIDMPRRIWADDSREEPNRGAHDPFGIWWISRRDGYTLYHRDDVVQRLREALRTAEAALADIGDADREDGDDLAWCEARAAKPLPIVRAALSALDTEEGA